MLRVSRLTQSLLFSAGIVFFGVAQTYANVELFTTSSDFTGWTSADGESVPTTSGAPTFDSDGSLINGAGNVSSATSTPPGTGPGGVSTSGSLAISYGGADGTNYSYNGIVSAPSALGPGAFTTALDPGSNPTAPGGGTSVAYSGTMLIDYTVPSSAPTTFQLGIDMKYSADGYYGVFLASGSTAITALDNTTGDTVMQATIPYTIKAGVFNGFGFSVDVNTSTATSSPFTFYIDNIQVVTPEPASLGLLGLTSLLGLRRRRA